MTAVGNTYFEKSSRDKNIDDCQQTGLKFQRTFHKFSTVNSISEIKDILKIFQFQEDTEASLCGDFKRIITYVKFVPCIMRCVLKKKEFFFNEKSLLVLFILPSSFCIESANDKVPIFQQ